MKKYDGAKRALLRRVGRESYQVSGREKYPSVALARETGLETDERVEQILVEDGGVARLRKGDVVLRRARVVEMAEGDVR